MPRNYRRISCRAEWGEEEMRQALEGVNRGGKLFTVARYYNIPRTTLRRHVDGLVKNPGQKHLGRASVLGPDTEKKLVDYILDFEKQGVGLSVMEIREIAFEYAEKFDLDHPFDQNNKRAGEDWWQGFYKRNKDKISIRKPESLSLARSRGMNREAIKKYFGLLEGQLKELGIENEPSCVWNCDESGLSLVPDTKCIVGEKGKRNVYQITSGERGVLTTVLPCYNAAGDYIPPMIVFKGKRVGEKMRADLPAGALVTCSDSGYMDKDLFYSWIKHFSELRRNGDKPALLILDGHGSHSRSIRALEYAKANNIHILCLPPHTTHWTQPQDRSFFKPLKTYHAHECRKLMREGAAITRNDFGKVFTPAYLKTATQAIAVKSFECTGIYPFNRDIFPDSAIPDNEAQNAEKDSQQGATPTKDKGESDAGTSVARDEQQLTDQIPNGGQESNEAPENGKQRDRSTASPEDEAPEKDGDGSFYLIRPLRVRRINPDGRRKQNSRATTSRVLTSDTYLKDLKKSEKEAAAKRSGSKKRGARSKENKNPGEKQPKKQKVTQNADEPENYCGGCGEHYRNSSEPWLQCRSCENWWEVSCAGMLGKPAEEQQQFICIEC